MQRRQYMRWTLGLLATLGAGSWLVSRAKNQTEGHSTATNTAPKTIMTASNLDKLEKYPDTIEPISLDKAEWKKVLDESRFHVLRKEGTERPFSSPLNDEKRDGEYVCAGCGLALFKANMKFDSGTGWPSFFEKIDTHVATKTDFKIGYPRTEYHCARCGGHQGHVFKDGPKPTGLRYCNNGLALRFIPAEQSNS